MPLSRSDVAFLPDAQFRLLSEFAWFGHLTSVRDLPVRVVASAPSGVALQCIPHFQGRLADLDLEGRLPLIEAAIRPTLLPALMAAGAPLNAVDHRGQSALRLACRESPHAAQILIAQGADLEAAHPGNKPTNWAGWTPLMLAAAFQDTLVPLLVAKGVALNTRNAQQETALRIAATKGNSAGFRCLLEAGAEDTGLFQTLKDTNARGFPPEIAHVWHGFCVRQRLQARLPAGRTPPGGRPRI